MTRQAVDPEEIEAVDLASENVRRTEEDESVAEREAEWRIAKEKVVSFLHGYNPAHGFSCTFWCP